MTACVGVTCCRVIWAAPRGALEGTRRVPEGQPGMSCHPTHLCDIGIKWGSDVALLVSEAGVGLWAPGGPAHWPHTQARKRGTHPGEGGGWGCRSHKLPPPASEHRVPQLRPVVPWIEGPWCPSALSLLS